MNQQLHDRPITGNGDGPIVKPAHRCVLCGVQFTGWGNNPQPLAEGHCCDDCNWTRVIPARFEQLERQL